MQINRVVACLAVMGAFLLSFRSPVLGADRQSAEMKVLPGHVPKAVLNLAPKGRLAATNQLRLAIGLPLRDPAGLDKFLTQVYDPASPIFHQFLTPEELTTRFGPTEQEYEAVKTFARTNGLVITATHPNRLVLDVVGPVAAVEKAFHLTLRTYQHPTEARDFYAPDTEPTVDAALPVADIQGLSDYAKPVRSCGRGTPGPSHPRPARLRTAPAITSATIFATPMRRE